MAQLHGLIKAGVVAGVKQAGANADDQLVFRGQIKTALGRKPLEDDLEAVAVFAFLGGHFVKRVTEGGCFGLFQPARCSGRRRRIPHRRRWQGPYRRRIWRGQPGRICWPWDDFSMKEGWQEWNFTELGHRQGIGSVETPFLRLGGLQRQSANREAHSRRWTRRRMFSQLLSAT